MNAPGRYHHGNLHRALIDAALELIQREGLARLSLRAVARRAGVSHAAPYHHFKDRAALIAGVAEEGFVLLRTSMLNRMEGELDPQLRFRDAGVAYVLFAAEHPAHFRVMFSAEVASKEEHPGLESAAEACRAVLTAAIAACQEVGVLRSGDPQILSLSAWSLVHGLSMLVIDGHVDAQGARPAATEALAEKVTGQLWSDLWTGPPPEAS